MAGLLQLLLTYTKCDMLLLMLSLKLSLSLLMLLLRLLLLLSVERGLRQSRRRCRRRRRWRRHFDGEVMLPLRSVASDCAVTARERDLVIRMEGGKFGFGVLLLRLRHPHRVAPHR